MKKLSLSTAVLATVFLVLLMAYLGSRAVQYESAKHERSQIEQQPGVREQRRKMNAGVLAVNAATQKERDEITERYKELDKAGIHGEQKKAELLKTIKASELEMNRTLQQIKKQQ